MAKTNNLESTKIAMESAAMAEASSEKKLNNDFQKITQQKGSKQVFLKKFPESWYKEIQTVHIGAMSDYVLMAVKQRMERDGLL